MSDEIRHYLTARLSLFTGKSSNAGALAIIDHSATNWWFFVGIEVVLFLDEVAFFGLSLRA